MNRVYLIGRGKLIMKDRCLVFERFENGNKKTDTIPINNLSSIMCIGKIGLSPLAIQNILRKGIIVTFLDSTGFFKGTLVPGSKFLNIIQINQMSNYLNNRIYLAKSFIIGLKKSTLLCFKLINDTISKEIYEKIESIEIEGDTIQEIMGRESLIWKHIYEYLKLSLPDFTNRIFNPPVGRVNCIISFGNSVLYSLLLVECIKAGLNPRIGFLHEINDKRNSLILDMSEIFKPFLILLLNVEILKKRLINDVHLEERNNGTYLNKLGKVTYLSYFDKFLKTTFYNLRVKRKMSLIEIIGMEFMKLSKSLQEFKPYIPLEEIC